MWRVIPVLIAVFFLGLSGCGRKGPLYLPRPAAGPAPAATTPSAPPRAAAHPAETAP